MQPCSPTSTGMSSLTPTHPKHAFIINVEKYNYNCEHGSFN